MRVTSADLVESLIDDLFEVPAAAVATRIQEIANGLPEGFEMLLVNALQRKERHDPSEDSEERAPSRRGVDIPFTAPEDTDRAELITLRDNSFSELMSDWNDLPSIDS